MQYGINVQRAKNIGDSIAKVRRRRGLTLDGLAELSLVSRASIAALEKGDGNPRVQTLWSLADALGVNFGTLMGKNFDEIIREDDGITVKLLERQNSPKIVEAFLLDIPAGRARQAKPHMKGVSEHVVVLAGEMQVGPCENPRLLQPGQSMTFSADVPHFYAAGRDQCRAIVTVVYPEDAYRTASSQQLGWPTHESDWDYIRLILRRAAIEAQNGIGISVIALAFPAGCNQDALLGQLRQQIANLPAASTVRRFVSAEEDAVVISLYRSARTRSLGVRPQALETDLAKRCWELASMLGKDLSQCQIEDLSRRASESETIVEAVLAAEVLTRVGRPTVPYGVGALRTCTRIQEDANARLFEARIDVDAYEAYELVHPAYARQTLAVAAALPQDRNLRILDVGTGPGLPLAMLRELRPDLRASAVDPSEIAISHLSRRFRDDPSIEIKQISITDLPPAETPFSCAVSIGASHHLDTSTFLSAIRNQLTTGGRLIIADEMLSPFRSREERQEALIRHHLWYILDTLVTLPDNAHSADIMISDRIALILPRAMALAYSGSSKGAVKLIRELYEDLMQIDYPTQPSHPWGVFSRFHLLELQALIAGFDYEVEQKTFSERFIALAAANDLNLTAHQRLYATDGDKPVDAGTHLFVFEAV